MDKHLKNIQRDTKAALNDFSESGADISTEFIQNFLKLSIDCMIETCKCFQTETPSTILEKANENTQANNSIKRKLEDIFYGVQPMNKKKASDTKGDSQLIYSNGNQIDDTTDTVFFCVYCLDKSEFGKSFSGTFDEVYSHWSSNHKSASNSFLFHAVSLSICLHCNKIGTYHDLVKHHNERHPNKAFGIADRNDESKCGICQFRGSNLIEHITNKHDCLPSIFNPICYSEQTIVKYSTTGIEQLSINDKNEPVYSICGFCKDKISHNNYLNHFKDHTYSFCCSQCAYKSTDLSGMVCHEKIRHDIESLNYHCSIFPGWIKSKFFDTNIVFANGLVLKTYNVRETKFDDSKLFDTFIGGYLDLKRERAKQMIERQIPNGAQDSREIFPTSTKKNHQSVSARETIPFNTVQSVVSIPKLSSNTISNKSLIAEINKQRKLVNNIFVTGIPRNRNYNDLLAISKRVCQKFGADIDEADINNIFQYPNCSGMVIELKRKDIKMKILCRSMDKCMPLSDLFQKDPRAQTDSRKPTITIQYHLTPYYFNLWQTALNLKKKRLLHSCRISDNSLVVKRTHVSSEEVILSKQQLIDHVAS